MTERQEFIDALRDIADWLDAHPEVPTPSKVIAIQLWCETKEDVAVTVRAMGSAKKEYSGDYFRASRMFGPIEVYVASMREVVCRRVVRGTETLTEKVPVEFEAREVEREIVEWVCDEPILRVEVPGVSP